MMKPPQSDSVRNSIAKPSCGLTACVRLEAVQVRWQACHGQWILGLETWNATLLVGKKPGIVCVMERYRVDTDGLTSTLDFWFQISKFEWSLSFYCWLCICTKWQGGVFRVPLPDPVVLSGASMLMLGMIGILGGVWLGRMESQIWICAVKCYSTCMHATDCQ